MTVNKGSLFGGIENSGLCALCPYKVWSCAGVWRGLSACVLATGKRIIHQTEITNVMTSYLTE